MRSRTVLGALLCAVLAWFAPAVQALTQEEAVAMSRGGNDQRLAAIRAIAVSDPGERTRVFLEALADRRVQLAGDRAFVLLGDTVVDAATGETVTPPEGAQRVVANNRLRSEIATVLASLRLFAEDREVRLVAARELARQPSADTLALLRSAEEKETDPTIAQILALARATVEVGAPDRDTRLAAARTLAASDTLEVRRLLRERLASTDNGFVEPDPEVRKALRQSYGDVEHRIFMSEIGGTLFAGLSLGSILLLAALGLAVTYGLMGVINLAHGEFIMIGAYATWLTQQAFRQWLPAGAFDAYLIAAIPVAFIAAALVGALLERTVIRHLYGRTLETLLATWGISLILMQTVRTLFGAQNVSVENPAWMSGGLVVSSTLVLPWSRIAIVVFAALVLVGVGLLIARTRLGLFVRAATQNRTMAQCVGVPTRRVDTLAFALGAGLAGLAGCALSQIGNVGPDLGQSYIVDSFLVVVVGGVGQLAGAVVAAIGLGIFNKILEDMSGAVIAKIILLAAVIVFIQKRPQGIFALRGRSAEA